MPQLNSPAPQLRPGAAKIKFKRLVMRALGNTHSGCSQEWNMSGAPGSLLNGVSWKGGDSREKGKIIVKG